MRLVIPDDEEIRMLRPAALVDAADDMGNLQPTGFQQPQVPLFQGLAHDGVVRVGEGPLG